MAHSLSQHPYYIQERILAEDLGFYDEPDWYEEPEIEEPTQQEEVKQTCHKTINWYLQQLAEMTREFREGKISHEIMALQLVRITYKINDEVLDYVTT
jgi:hypothetical protein